MAEFCFGYEGCPAPQAARTPGLSEPDRYRLLGLARRTLVLGECPGFNPDIPEQCNNSCNRDGQVTETITDIASLMCAVDRAYSAALAPVEKQERALAEATRKAAEVS